MSVLWVTKKEIRDHIQSKRFLMIFGALLLVVILSMSQGVDQYNDALDKYKWITSEIGENTRFNRFMPEKPSMLLIFETMTDYFIPIGAVLAIAMGFDLISGEKEEGSLKSLLSHPLFRDNIIIGKLFGAFATLMLVMVVVTFTSTGVLMIYGISPSSNEFLRILAYMGFSLIFMLAFFSIGMLSSTITNSSGNSIAYCIGIVLVISFMVPYVGTAVTEEYAGEEPNITDFVDMGIDMGMENNEATEAERQEQREQIQEYQKEYQEYWNKKTEIERIFNIFSPHECYENITDEITGASNENNGAGKWQPQELGQEEEKSLAESFKSVLPETLSLLMISVIMLVASYVKFMRLDIR